jgi:hypothetical protein
MGRCEKPISLNLRTRVILPMPSSSDDFADRSEHLALAHVVRLEELAAGSSPSSVTTG